MGIASAALLAGEPFGAPQAIGAALVAMYHKAGN